ncbi:hypothetical protein [Dactylococcopsis salina]|uniref:hypothetical protein n=1 Tax=Dactylococcopsis salina TaxID=292566 RepID=UPI000316B7BA|nr:hypothetical protein [Dactylococcopsis salina]
MLDRRLSIRGGGYEKRFSLLSGAFSKIGNTSHCIRIFYQETRSSATPEKKILLLMASLGVGVGDDV